MPKDDVASLVRQNLLSSTFESDDSEEPEWLLPKYVQFCTRLEPLRLVEGRLLGLETVIKISMLRENMRYKSNFNRSLDTIVSLVKYVFLDSSG